MNTIAASSQRVPPPRPDRDRRARRRLRSPDDRPLRRARRLGSATVTPVATPGVPTPTPTPTESTQRRPRPPRSCSCRPSSAGRARAPLLQGRCRLALRRTGEGRPRRRDRGAQGRPSAGAGFVAINVGNDKTAAGRHPVRRPVSLPSMLVVRRPGKIVARFERPGRERCRRTGGAQRRRPALSKQSQEHGRERVVGRRRPSCAVPSRGAARRADDRHASRRTRRDDRRRGRSEVFPVTRSAGTAGLKRPFTFGIARSGSPLRRRRARRLRVPGLHRLVAHSIGGTVSADDVRE